MEDQIGQIESFLRLLFSILGYIAMPGLWAESLIFWMLGLPTSTSFRMFPPADIVPGHDYPTSIAYSYVLITMLFIPSFISSDRYFDGSNTLGSILRPLTRRANPSMEFAAMFARVWLAAAWVNAATAQFMTDWVLWTFCAKLGCVYLIL
ncbi:hypothetical protein TrVFT333_008791 [Trichoderma virens FT-333]|nr:hypothetical protein TrVFT333_008791 [Trichoderma virens FT-333]